jgi:hypothetical protein
VSGGNTPLDRGRTRNGWVIWDGQRRYHLARHRVLTIEKVQSTKPAAPRISVRIRRHCDANSPCLSFCTTSLCNVPDTQTRRVTRKDTPRLCFGIQKAEKVALDLDTLDDGLDDQVGRGYRFSTARRERVSLSLFSGGIANGPHSRVSSGLDVLHDASCILFHLLARRASRSRGKLFLGDPGE